MSLNAVQVRHVNEVVRPFAEALIKGLTAADQFIAEHGAFQTGADALPVDATVLDDAGDAPRDDAPQIDGVFVQSLFDLASNLSAQADTATRAALIQKAVRNLSQILR